MKGTARLSKGGRKKLITQQRIRSENLKQIYQLVNQNIGVSRARLAKITELSKTTVSSLVDELIEGGYIVDCGAGTSQQQGRRPNELRVNGAGNVVAVISWRRARLDVALVASDSKVLLRSQVPLEEQDDGVEKITRTFFEMLLPAVGESRLLGVSIIIPGIVDGERRRILSTVIGVGFEDSVVNRLEKALEGYPVCLLNDTACFAYAESVFTHIDEAYFAYINVSKGVGACLFADGKMLRGAGAIATQFGHFSIDRNGPQCACGNRGCLERIVGENALSERAAACGMDMSLFTGRKLLYSDVGAMAQDGDACARALIRGLAQDLAFGISNLISLFNPSLIVIGGTGVNLGPYFLSDINESLSNMGFREFVSHVWLQYSQLGLDSELVGAARYYIDHYYDFLEHMQSGLFL